MSICAASANLTTPPEGDIGNVLENTAIAFIVILTLLLGLRYFARHQARTPWGWEDIMIPLAWISNIGICGVSIAMVRAGGAGHHVLWLCMVDPMKLTTYAKLQLPFSIFLSLGVGLGKIAILGLFLRIFLERRYVYTTYALIGIQVAAMIAAIVVSCVMCTPISYLWEPQKHPNGHCININLWWQWGNIPQTVTDVIILVLPLPALWSLQLSTRNKIGVILTMCTGSVGLVASIVRPAVFEDLMGGGDMTYGGSKIGCLSIGESGAYLIAACLPTYRTLFRSVKRKLGQGSKQGSKTYPSPINSNTPEAAEPNACPVHHKAGFNRLSNDTSFDVETCRTLDEEILDSEVNGFPLDEKKSMQT